GGELPNPKSLLAIASRPTKTTLGRLGVFSVSSFHALGRGHSQEAFVVSDLQTEKEKSFLLS
ncbi:T-lymphoma invasion and metastasis-inducing protein 1, partial [Xenoophorus captivus]